MKNTIGILTAKSLNNARSRLLNSGLYWRRGQDHCVGWYLSPELYALYDSTVMALKLLRDVHIRVVLTCK
jgi:hypothetical protein